MENSCKSWPELSTLEKEEFVNKSFELTNSVMDEQQIIDLWYHRSKALRNRMYISNVLSKYGLWDGFCKSMDFEIRMQLESLFESTLISLINDHVLYKYGVLILLEKQQYGNLPWSFTIKNTINDGFIFNYSRFDGFDTHYAALKAGIILFSIHHQDIIKYREKYGLISN